MWGIFWWTQCNHKCPSKEGEKFRITEGDMTIEVEMSDAAMSQAGMQTVEGGKGKKCILSSRMRQYFTLTLVRLILNF